MPSQHQAANDLTSHSLPPECDFIGDQFNFYKKEHGKCLEEYIERWFYPTLSIRQLRLQTNLTNMT